MSSLLILAVVALLVLLWLVGDRAHRAHRRAVLAEKIAAKALSVAKETQGRLDRHVVAVIPPPSLRVVKETSNG
jgi:type II secretory pathway pseudopilin PulG